MKNLNRTVLSGSLLLGLAPLLAWRGFPEYMHLKQAFVQIFGLALLGYALLCRPSCSLRVFRGWRALTFVLVFLSAWPLVFAVDPGDGWFQVSYWLVCLCAGYLIGGAIAGDRDGRILCGAIFGAGTVTAVIGLLQLFGIWEGFDQVRAPAATFANKNMAAQWIVMVWPAALGLLFFSRKPAVPVFVSAGSLLMLLYLFSTGTRAALLATLAQVCLAALICLPRFKDRITKKHMPFLGAVGGLMFAAAFLFWKLPGDAEGDPRYWRSTVQQSLEARMSTWERSAALILDEPLGIGALQTEGRLSLQPVEGALEHGKLGVREHRLHNDLLQLVIEGGIPALLVLLALAGVCGARLFPLLKSNVHATAGANPYLLVGLVGVVGLGVNALFSFPLYRALPPLLGALYFAWVTREPGLPTLTAGKREPVARIAGVLVLLAVVPLAWLHGRHLVADRAFYGQAQAVSGGDFTKALEYGERALRAWPRHRQARELTGRTLIQMGEFTKALLVFEDLREQSPGNSSYQYHHGLVHFSLENWGEAGNLLEPLLLRFPENPRLHFLMGSIHFRRDAYPQAYAAFHEASRLDPGNFEYARNLGITALRAGWPSLAAHAFRHCLRLRPGDPQMQALLRRVERTP